MLSRRSVTSLEIKEEEEEEEEDNSN